MLDAQFILKRTGAYRFCQRKNEISNKLMAIAGSTG